MLKTRPPYPPEFRERRIEVVRKGRTPEELARRRREFDEQKAIARELRVEKAASRTVTRTMVTTLDGAARVEELARMLGGERVTETTRRAAREMLREARREGRREG